MTAEILSAQAASTRPAETAGVSLVAMESPFSPNPPRRRDAATGGGGPDVFGSVALEVGSTPMDRQWRQASADQPSQAVRHWAAAFSRDDNNAEVMLQQVNLWVNARIRFADDAGPGRADQWSGAARSLAAGRGDCEDYALTKLQLLTAAGFDGRRLFLVVVRDLVRRADHAVLVARVGSRYLVLDNMTDAVIDSNEIEDYRPVMSFSASGRWVHGYPVAPSRGDVIRIAAAATTAAP
jgi:predicted transglutaminase-like cysteine proteinase